MNPNGNPSFSDSAPNGIAPPGSSSYLNHQQLPMNTGMQWPPQSSLYPTLPPQTQASGGWQQQQQLQQPLQPQIPNGMPIGQPTPMPQQTLASFNASLASLFPANILQDVFRMSAPVGFAPDDDALLVQTLKDSTEKGQTYKQAIETLHGVCHQHQNSSMLIS